MSWESWNDFLAMGGYAPYVWGSYVVTLGLMALESSLLIARKRNLLKYLGRYSQARQESSMSACQRPSADHQPHASSASQQQDFTEGTSAPRRSISA